MAILVAFVKSKVSIEMLVRDDLVFILLIAQLMSIVLAQIAWCNVYSEKSEIIKTIIIKIIKNRNLRRQEDPLHIMQK